MNKIGVITPTFNRPNLLLKLHESLFETGTGVNWVHLVVDDGSSMDYREVLKRCHNLSGRLKVERIQNSGPLIARNHSIDMAMAEQCTHLCFVDDDDILIGQGLQAINKRIEEFNEDWFIFGSIETGKTSKEWPTEYVEMRWFQDVVMNNRLSGDNLIVLTSSIVGSSRFCLWGKSQREWTFFMDISKKNDAVFVMPEIIMQIHYSAGGLTKEAENNKISSPAQIYNNLERSFSYWFRKPGSAKLSINLLKQLSLSPLKLLRYFLIRVFSWRNL